MSEAIWIGGLHAVAAALRRGPGPVRELWLDTRRRDPAVQRLRALAERHGIPIHSASAQELDARVPGLRHQGALVRSDGTSMSWNEEDILRLLDETDTPPFLLILDGVQDPHNLGACLRSADAAGVHAVIAPRDRATGLTPTVRKVACGAAETTPFIAVTNLARTLRTLRDRGVVVLGADAAATDTLYQADLRGPLALALGAEDTGLRRLTKEHCDFLIQIPLKGAVESLNVSVAAGVCLFEAVRQRQ